MNAGATVLTMADLITETGIPHWLQPTKQDHGDFYSEITWETALEQLASGMTLKSICSDPTMPEYGRFLRWIHADPGRKRRYREAQELATESINDTFRDKVADADDMTDIARLTLEFNHVKWLTGVWNRDRYGERKQVDVNDNVDLREAMAAAQTRVEQQAGRIIEGEVLSESQEEAE